MNEVFEKKNDSYHSSTMIAGRLRTDIRIYTGFLLFRAIWEWEKAYFNELLSQILMADFPRWDLIIIVSWPRQVKSWDLYRMSISLYHMRL